MVFKALEETKECCRAIKLEQYTLNVWHREIQLVLFSPSVLMFPETKSKETSGLEENICTKLTIFPRDHTLSALLYKHI